MKYANQSSGQLLIVDYLNPVYFDVMAIKLKTISSVCKIIQKRFSINGYSEN